MFEDSSTGRSPVHGPMGAASEAIAFLEALARALHAYGTPSHRVEEALVRIGARLGVSAQFLVTPTSILASFGEGEQQHLRLSRVDAGETDLDKLARLHEVIREVFAGELGPREALVQIEAIRARPPRYGRWTTLGAFALTSATAARFFDGGWVEIATSGGLGLGVGLLVLYAGNHPRIGRLVPALGAVGASLVAAAIATQMPLFTPIVILAALIVLLPGLTLTVAMNEVALGHIVSGSARLTSAMGTFLQLGFGVALGTRLVGSLESAAPGAKAGSLPEITLVPTLALAALALTALFRARPGHGWIVLTMSTVAYGASRLGSANLGPEIGAAVGSLVLGVAANAVARWRDIPTAIPLIPALLLLVPGSLGFRSLQALLADDVLAGVEGIFSMSIVAVGLVSGLLVANLAVTPRRLL